MTKLHPLHPAMYAPDQHRSDLPSPDQGRAPQRHEVINVPLLFWTGVLLVVATPSLYFWHRHQVQNSASDFLAQAASFEKAEKWRRAAQMLDRYLKLRPDDAVVRTRLADDYAKSVVGPETLARAVDFYSQAMGFAPKDLELRRKRADLELELASYTPARFQAVIQDADKILDSRPHDVSGLRLKALALWGQAQTGRKDTLVLARAALQEAVKHMPEDVQLSVQLAMLYRNDFPGIKKAERQAQGRKVLDDLVNANPANPEAFLARFRYRLLEQLPDADKDLQKALELDPQHLESLIAAGGRAGSLNQMDESRKHFEKAMEVAPQDPRAYLGLAETYATRGAYERAVEVWRRGLDSVPATDPNYAAIHLRLAEGLLAAGKLTELAKVIELLAHDVSELNTLVPRALRQKLDARLLFFQSRIKLAEGDVFGALTLLRSSALPQQVANEADPDQQHRLQSAYYLGICYAGLRQWDLAAESYQRASTHDPTNPKYLLAAADAWEQAGRFDLAVKLYEQALALRGTDPEVWVLLARTHFNEQMQLPVERRDWQYFRDALKKARRAVPYDVTLKVLEADFAVVLGQPAEAVTQLEQAQREVPDSEILGRALTLAYERVGRREDADRALAAYLEQQGEGLRAKRLRVAVLSSRGELDQADEVLRQALDEAPVEERPSLTYQLAQVHLRSGDLEEARHFMTRLADENPQNVPLIEQAIRMALDVRDFAEVERWEARLQELEGLSGTLWRYYQAERLLSQAESRADARFERAKSVADELRDLRESWPPVYLLLGQIAEVEGSVREAIEHYERAIYLGEGRVTCYERLIRLMYQTRRFAEAEQYLTRLRDLISNDSQLAEVAISMLAERGRVAQAVRLAEATVERRPDDSLAYVWLGQSLQLADRSAEAERAFQKAVELAPRDAETWIALVGFYTRQGRPAQALAALEQLASSADLRAEDRDFVLAQGFEMVGDRAKADAAYRRAVELAPDRVDVLQQAAEFFLTGDDAMAEKTLRRLMVLVPDAIDVRRRLIAMLRRRGGERDWREVEVLLDQANAQQTVKGEDLRLRAQLLISRGGVAERDEAIELLEQLVQTETSYRADDLLLLARLQEADGRLLRARELLLSLASAKTATPEHVAAYLELLLRHGFGGDAVPWVERLEQLAPDSYPALLYRARWMKTAQPEADLAAFVAQAGERRLALAADDVARAQVALELGAVYDQVELPDLAEKWYRQAVGENPAHFAHWAVWLARHGRADEGIEACLAAAEQKVPLLDVGKALGQVIREGQTSEAAQKSAEPVLAEAISRHSRDIQLLLAIGELRYMQDRPADAIELFRRALELESQNVTALVRLALLLSEQPVNQGEALKYVRQAIGIAGERDELRDALGVVLLNQGQVDEAYHTLREVADDVPDEPRYAFHLALACQQSGARSQARAAIRKAREAGLDPLTLPLAERRRLEQLEASLVVTER